MTHTHPQTLSRTPLEEGLAHHKDLYLHNTQQSQETDIRTRNPNKATAANPRLRPQSQRDRLGGINHCYIRQEKKI